MTDTGLFAAAPAETLDAMFVPFAAGDLTLPVDGRVFFLRARASVRLREMASKDWLCQQTFLPFADELGRNGLQVGEPAHDETFPLVLVLPPRQRDEARAAFARGLCHLQPGGTLLACMPNAEGAKSGEGDMRALVGAVQHRSKHKCRVFWASPAEADINRGLLETWRALDAVRELPQGYVSRPGLFAWDRVDRGSALLAANLPADLHGRVADLGAGYGYLAAEIIRRSPQVEAIDLYEAEARALEPARINLQNTREVSGRPIALEFYWHDVTRRLHHRYDAIISNPPFHQGRADLPALGRAFIVSAAQALRPDGRLLLVANRHLPYESELASRFATVRQLVVQDGFKIIEASGVRG